jgi:hypothetical protein
VPITIEALRSIPLFGGAFIASFCISNGVSRLPLRACAAEATVLRGQGSWIQ